MNILPRWIIFCLDLLFCIFALCFAYFIKFDFDIKGIDLKEFSRNILKNRIVDICLENDIKVLTLPPIRNWINGQLFTNQLQNIRIEDLL